MSKRATRIGIIGMAHPHILPMIELLIGAGAELAAYVPESHWIGELVAGQHPNAVAHPEPTALLEDPTIDVVVSAAIPNERADLGIAAMERGKDFVSDKPGFTDVRQLDRARAATKATGRRYVVWFSERFDSRATGRALELVRGGAIGRVLHTVGLGPHRLGLTPRPKWFYERARYGGILTDLASHQMDQFLAITGATSARVTTARVANRAHPEHPELQDFGEILLETDDHASGYVRVDWFTPDGLPTWGDGRLLVVGTEGQIEVRKYVDLAGRDGGDHLFLVDREGTRYMECAQAPLPFASQLLADLVDRTETAVSQAHVFHASELALQAQALAEAS